MQLTRPFTASLRKTLAHVHFFHFSFFWQLAFATQEDLASGTGSSLAQTRFAQPHHPTNKSLQQSSIRAPVHLNPALAGGGRFVDFAPPIFHEHEGYNFSDSQEEEEEEEEEDQSEGSFEGGSAEDLQTDTGIGFDEDEIDENEGQSGEGDNEDMEEAGDESEHHEPLVYTENPNNIVQGHPHMHFVQDARQINAPSDDERVLQPISNHNRASQAQQQVALGVGRPAQVQAAHSPSEPNQQWQPQQQQQSLIRKQSIDEQLRMEKENQERQSSNTPPRLIRPANQRSPSSSSSSTHSARLLPFLDSTGEITPTGYTSSDTLTNGNIAETRKISLTPRIARDTSVESNLSERALSPTPSDYSTSIQQQQQQQTRAPFRNISNVSSAPSASTTDHSDLPKTSNESLTHPDMGKNANYANNEHLRRGSAGSVTTASSTVSSLSTSKEKDSHKRAGSPAATEVTKEPKKKRSTGILGGLFSRGKKDKEKDKEKDKDKKQDKKASSVSSASNSPIPSDSRKGSMSTLASEDDRISTNSSPAPQSPERTINTQGFGGGNAKNQQRRADDHHRDEMFGTDAALRQQQVEAQNAMYHQYGIHARAPGDVTNTSTFSATRSPSSSSHQQYQQPQQQQTSTSGMSLSPSSASMLSGLGNSQSGHNASGKRRPGSLINSPHMFGSGPNGGEVPVLNVLRVFAGENIISEATFKTVLLNETTMTEDLVKQVMQRFRLTPPPDSISPDGTPSTANIMAEYYLTAKEVSGDETWLEMGQKPLTVFEYLSKANPGAGLPSVKRSSVGSINSIASNLSLNPAIEKLRMSDFSDDSVVKLFLNKRTPDISIISRSHGHGGTGERTSQDSLSINPNRLSATGSIVDKGPAPGMPSSPMLRFAVKVVIHSQDLPDSMVFDPSSPAIIPKSALLERQSIRSSLSQSQQSNLVSSSSTREKIIYFPRNANVSEVLETALDRFGIVEGVVDGGDEVEDKLSKRRSITRIRYCLAMRFSEQHGGEGESKPYALACVQKR